MAERSDVNAFDDVLSVVGLGCRERILRVERCVTEEKVRLAVMFGRARLWSGSRFVRVPAGQCAHLHAVDDDRHAAANLMNAGTAQIL
jgi:hypothetical protein